MMNLKRLNGWIDSELKTCTRLDSFMFQSPAEKYQEIMEKDFLLTQEVPQYMIASYFGVKPETLSRIRKRATVK